MLQYIITDTSSRAESTGKWRKVVMVLHRDNKYIVKIVDI